MSNSWIYSCNYLWFGETFQGRKVEKACADNPQAKEIIRKEWRWTDRAKLGFMFKSLWLSSRKAKEQYIMGKKWVSGRMSRAPQVVPGPGVWWWVRYVGKRFSCLNFRDQLDILKKLYARVFCADPFKTYCTHWKKGLKWKKGKFGRCLLALKTWLFFSFTGITLSIVAIFLRPKHDELLRFHCFCFFFLSHFAPVWLWHRVPRLTSGCQLNQPSTDPSGLCVALAVVCLIV